MEKLAENVNMADKDRFRLVTDNIALEVWMLKEDSKPVIGLAAHSDEKTPTKLFKADDIATVFQKSELFDANVDAAIELPREAFEPKVKGNCCSTISLTLSHYLIQCFARTYSALFLSKTLYNICLNLVYIHSGLIVIYIIVKTPL